MLERGSVQVRGDDGRLQPTEVAALEREPAWYDSTDLSPRDPIFTHMSRAGVAQANVCEMRQVITERMERAGVTRPADAPLHW